MPRTRATSHSARQEERGHETKQTLAAALPDLPRELPLLPIRDNVHFPHMIFPLFVGREKSVRALDEAGDGSQHILLVAQKQMGDGRPGAGRHLRRRHRRRDHADPESAGRHRARDAGRRRPRPHRRVHCRPSRSSRSQIEPLPPMAGHSLEAEALMRSRHGPVRADRQHRQEHPAGSRRRRCSTSTSRAASPTTSPGTCRPCASKPSRSCWKRSTRSERLQKLSVLLTKEFEILEIQKNIRNRVEKEMGDTQREFILREQMKAIQQELGERDERQSEVDEYRAKIAEARHARGGRGARPQGDRPAGKDAAPRPKASSSAPIWTGWSPCPGPRRPTRRWTSRPPKRCWTRTTTACRKSRSASWNSWPCASWPGRSKARSSASSARPASARPASARSIARALGRKFVRISPGRRPRRGRDPRPPAHLHRRAAGPHHPGPQADRRRATRSSCWTRSTRWASDFRGDPSSALLEALDPEQNTRVHRPLPGSAVRPVRRHVHHHGQPARPDPAGPARPHGGDLVLRLHRGREAADRQAVPGAQADQGERPDRKARSRFPTTRHRGRSSASTPAKRACATWSARSARSAARSPAASPRAHTSRSRIGPDELHDLPGPAQVPLRRHGGDRTRSARRPAWSTPRSAATSSPSRSRLLRGKDGRLTLTGQLGDVMKESAQAALSYVRAARPRSGHRRRVLRAHWTSTSTCPPAPSPRTAPRPASPGDRAGLAP